MDRAEPSRELPRTQDPALRRRRAAVLFRAGVTQAEVGRRLGVSRQTAHRWYGVWMEGGEAALHASTRRGPHAGLSDDDVRSIGDALRDGPRAHGFADDHWTVRQVGWIIHQLTGISYHPSHVGRLLRRHGWPVRPPAVP